MKFTLILATLGRSDEVRRMLECLKKAELSKILRSY